MQLVISAFQDGDAIPVKYTADGNDFSPPIAWADLPEGTKSLALVADDPDAPRGTWVHWVLYNLSPDTRSLCPARRIIAAIRSADAEGLPSMTWIDVMALMGETPSASAYSRAIRSASP